MQPAIKPEDSKLIEIEDVIGSDEKQSYIDSATNIFQKMAQANLLKENDVTPRKSDQYQQQEAEADASYGPANQ